jgi:transcriptional regulator with XRE-family HTH domain
VTKRQLTKLAGLLQRIRNVAQQTGKRMELADYLGKPPQRVSEWLNGKYEPGAEVTLLMQEWVQAEEAKQQKTLGSAINTTKGRKTRKPNPSYEKKLPNPKKR